MATMTVKLPEVLIIKLSRLEKDKEKIIGNVLKAGASVMRIEAGHTLDSAIGSDLKFEPRSTGELVSSLGVSPVKEAQDGFNIKVGFNEPRRKQYIAKKRRSYNKITNAMIGNVLEHGKKNAEQNAKNMFKSAEKRVRNKAVKAMNDEFDRQYEKL